MDHAGLLRVEAATFGFGPFTLLGRRLLREPAAVRLHHVLQRLADRRVPILRATGNQYIVLGRKRGRR
jgi:hypothetical protein